MLRVPTLADISLRFFGPKRRSASTNSLCSDGVQYRLSPGTLERELRTFLAAFPLRLSFRTLKGAGVGVGVAVEGAADAGAADERKTVPTLAIVVTPTGGGGAGKTGR